MARKDLSKSQQALLLALDKFENDVRFPGERYKLKKGEFSTAHSLIVGLHRERLLTGDLDGVKITDLGRLRIAELRAQREPWLKTLVHVNMHVIRANQKTGARDPVLTVKRGKVNRYAHAVEIAGPSRVVYSPDKPLSCGARVWIETEAEVTLVGEVER